MSSHIPRLKSWLHLFGFGLVIVALAGCPPPGDCLQCESFETVGVVSTGELLECSGLVASQSNPGVLWAHNDSGDTARLFAMTEDGDLRGIYTLDGAGAVDWEDMAWGPCSALGWSDCLYVGDIGDNGAHRSQIQIYRVPEPIVPLEGPPAVEVLIDVERFDCYYPDAPHDAETLLVDPETAIPYIVTKEEQGTTTVYRFPASPIPFETVALEAVSVLGTVSFLTGGDVSPDISRIVLRNYLVGFEYTRLPGEAFHEMFLRPPCNQSLALEPQGEALAVGPSGMAIYTVSEGAYVPIHRADCALP